MLEHLLQKELSMLVVWSAKFTGSWPRQRCCHAHNRRDNPPTVVTMRQSSFLSYSACYITAAG